MRPTAPFLLALALLPNALAGTPDAPEVTDAAGDAGPAGPAPGGFGWADLVALWLDDENAETVTLNLRVADPAPPPADGVVGSLFTLHGQRFIAGYGAIVFPGVPPVPYRGGYLCPADAEGNPTGDCASPAATFERGLHRVVLARADLGAPQPGDLLEGLRGESGNHLGGLVWVPHDGTTEGAAFPFEAGSGGPLEVASAGPGAPSASTPQREPPRATPDLGPPWLAALGVLALLVQRRSA